MNTARHIFYKTILLLCPLYIICGQTVPSLDLTFAGTGKVTKNIWHNDFSRSVAVQQDKKILVGGNMNSLNPNIQSYFIVRYNEDGTLDNSFGVNGVSSLSDDNQGWIQSMIPLADGKTIVAGLWGCNNFVGRILADGSFDTSFGTNGRTVLTNACGYFRDLEILQDGSIVAYGSQGYNNNESAILAKFTPNGQPDFTFGTNGFFTTKFNHQTLITSAMAVQSDGKFIISGSAAPFVSYPAYNQLFLARYHANGTLDASFGNNGLVLYNADARMARDIAVTSTDKIVVAAELTDAIITSIGPTSTALVLRFNTDGTLDTTFNNNAGSTGFGAMYFLSVKTSPDDKIYVSASHFNYTSYNDFHSLIRLNSDGTRDTSFGTNGIYHSNISLHPTLPVSGNNNMTFAPDGKLVISSHFNTPNFDFLVARFNVGAAGLNTSESAVNAELKVFPNPATDYLYIRSKEKIIKTEIFNALGQLVRSNGEIKTIHIRDLPAGIYYLTITAENGKYRQKFIKKP